MIKKYALLVIFLFLQTTILKSAVFPETLHDWRWHTIESVKNGDASLIIRSEFNALRESLNNWQENGVCNIKSYESKTKKDSIAELEEKIRLTKLTIATTENKIGGFENEIKEYEKNINILKEKISINTAKINNMQHDNEYKGNKDEDRENFQGIIHASRQDIEKLTQHIATAEKNKESGQKVLEQTTTKLPELQEEKRKITEQVKNPWELTLLHNKLQQLALKHMLFNDIQEIETDNEEEKELSVYIHALIASFVSEKTAITHDFLNLRTSYQSYILAVGNFLNWYAHENNAVYVAPFETLTKHLKNPYKKSYVAIILHGLTYYKTYRLIERKNTTEEQIAKEICELLKPFKDDKNFRDIYDENCKKPENAQEREINGKQIATILCMTLLIIALYNHKKILKWLK